MLALNAYAAELKAQEVKAWQDYIQAIRGREQEHLRAESHFLKIDADQAWLASVRNGEVLVLRGGPQNLNKIPSGVIHDWLGAAFIANTTLNDVLSIVRDYERYKEFYAPTVIESIPLTKGGSEDRFSMVLMNKSLFLKTAVSGDYHCSYVRVSDGRWYGITESTRIQEIENYGAPGQRVLPEGEGSGFIWRLFSITRFEERDGGVYVELEAMALSRNIPLSLRWVVEPIVCRVSRNSLTTSLRQIESAVRSGATRADRFKERERSRTVPNPSPVKAQTGLAETFR
jgi:hypothetical protein